MSLDLIAEVYFFLFEMIINLFKKNPVGIFLRSQ